MAVLEPKKTHVESHPVVFSPSMQVMNQRVDVQLCSIFVYRIYIYDMIIPHVTDIYIYILLLHTPSWYQIMGYIHISFYWLYI